MTDVAYIAIITGLSIAFLALLLLKRVRITFDINKFLNDRRERWKEEQRALCPHVDSAYDAEGKPVLRSTYGFHKLRRLWICSKCGDHETDKATIDKDLKYWADHSDELMKRVKRIIKLSKKLSGQ